MNPGFDPSHVLDFRVSGDWREMANYDQLVGRIDRTLEALAALPGVVSAATTVFVPGVPAQYENTVELVGARDESERRMVAETRPCRPSISRRFTSPSIESRA